MQRLTQSQEEFINHIYKNIFSIFSHGPGILKITLAELKFSRHN